MPRLIMALLLLAACAADPPPDSRFRREVPIYSNATFDPARMAGQWHQSAAFADPGASPCPVGRAEIGPGLVADLRLCLNGQQVAEQGRFVPSGPGRLRFTGTGLPGADWWMLWVDADYRTLAIGTPDGSFGLILNRGGPVPPDRLQAARELFDFNGYDLSRMVMLR